MIKQSWGGSHDNDAELGSRNEAELGGPRMMKQSCGSRDGEADLGVLGGEAELGVLAPQSMVGGPEIANHLYFSYLSSV